MGKPRNAIEGYNRDIGLDTLIEYDGSNNAIFVGNAYPGALTSEAKWQIMKLSYDSSNNMIEKRWAKLIAPTNADPVPTNNDEFNKQWTLRNTYDYSGL